MATKKEVREIGNLPETIEEYADRMKWRRRLLWVGNLICLYANFTWLLPAVGELSDIFLLYSGAGHLFTSWFVIGLTNGLTPLDMYS